MIINRNNKGTNIIIIQIKHANNFKYAKSVIRLRVKLRHLVAGVTLWPAKNTDAKVRFNSLVLPQLRSQELVRGLPGRLYW